MRNLFIAESINTTQGTSALHLFEEPLRIPKYCRESQYTQLLAPTVYRLPRLVCFKERRIRDHRIFERTGTVTTETVYGKQLSEEYSITASVEKACSTRHI
ncbi:hypothetical protein TGMAS_417500 [Toxoplasma gondii MAS]|uniref:Uncharacterized protein n=1 Tax=Toxoplasma gondii MAS TaxID=943118 RepID=A0A086PIH4_TOXGO|nr:hypothetical protein TGMAS_417500 [Toxoplasma gondii MAS]